MATFSIPNNLGQMRQVNRGVSSGEFSETFNIDLISEPGKIKTSTKLSRILSESDFDSESPADILAKGGNGYIVTSGELYNNLSDLTDGDDWNKANIVGDNFNTNSTMCVFDGSIIVADTTDLAKWDGSSSFDDNWWTNVISGTALSSSYPHNLAVSQSQKETLFVLDGNVVRYYEKDAASTQNVELSTSHIAICQAPALDGSMWVGTANEESDKAYVYQVYTNEQVDGTPVYRQAFPVDGRAILAIWVRDNTPFIITDKGLVQQFNGVGFTTINQFPFSFGSRYLNGVQSGLIQTSNRARPIHPNGIKVSRDVAFIMVNAEAADDGFPVNSRFHSGVWTFDHNTNQLSHYKSLSEAENQYGNSALQNSGSVLLLDDVAGEMLVIGGVNNDDGVFAATSDYGLGLFVTPEITSDSVQASLEAVYHKAELSDDAEIYTLYRTTRRDTVRFTANWATTNTFTSTDDLSELEVGDLVRVSHQYAAGNWSVVKKIQKSINIYTIELKDAIGLAGEVSKAYSDNFRLFGFDTDTLVYDTINTYTASDGELKQLGGDVVGGWIQLMVILKGQVTYRQLLVKYTAKNEI